MQASRIYRLLIFSSSIVVLSQCTSNEIAHSKDVSQDKIYQQYSISYAEGQPDASVNAQFRFGGSNGTTLVLDNPSQLAFDEELITVDSGSLSGAYYRLFKPVTNFYGMHHFTFTDINNKKFDNGFPFEAFSLINVPASVSKKKSFAFGYEPVLNGSDYIVITATNTDSSFTITHYAKDGNAITIGAEQLKPLGGNELTLQATLLRSFSLAQTAAQGGSLYITYTLLPVTIRLR